MNAKSDSYTLTCRGAALPYVRLIGGGHRVPPAGLPIEQVFGEYSLSFLRRDVALFVSTRAWIASEIGGACLRSNS